MLLTNRIWKAVASLSAFVLMPFTSTPANAFTYLFLDYGSNLSLVTDQGTVNPTTSGYSLVDNTGFGQNVTDGWAPMVSDWYGPGLGSIKGFYTFDLSSLAGPVSQAAVVAGSGYYYMGGAYSDQSPRIGLHLFNSTSLALNGLLVNSTDSGGLNSALTQGSEIGSLSFNWMDFNNYFYSYNGNPNWFNVNLNSAGIEAINNALGSEIKTFAVGASIGPVAPAPLAGTGMLAAFAALIALLVTRGSTLIRNLPGLRKYGTA